MHASSRLFSCGMELFAFASRLFAPKMLDHLPTTSVCHSNPFFLPSKRSGRNRPLREAPCICIRTWPFQAKNRYDAKLANRRVPRV